MLQDEQQVVVVADASHVYHTHVLQAVASWVNDDLREPFLASQEIDATVEVNGQIGGLETDPAVLAVYVWDPGAGDVAGNSCEVPGKRDPSVSDPASGECPTVQQLYPPVSIPLKPRQSPQFLAVVVYVAMETNLCVLDEITCRVDVKIWDPETVCWKTCLHSNTMVFSDNSTNQCYVRVTTRATNSHLRAFPWPGECNAFMQPWILASKDAKSSSWLLKGISWKTINLSESCCVK